MTYLKRGDRRQYVVTLFDGRASGTVYIADGYDRALSGVVYVSPVRTRTEAIEAAIEDGLPDIREQT